MAPLALAKVLATAGLALSAVGAFLLFRFGLPFRNRTGGEQILWTGGYDAETAAAERRADRLGWAGFLIGIAGVGLQIAAVWVA